MPDTMIDAWNSNAFGVVSMTASINNLPTKPGFITKMGLFAGQGVTTKYVSVDVRDQTLSLVPTIPRGGPAPQSGHATRRALLYEVPHHPIEDAVTPDDYDSIREFGKSSVMSGPTTLINDRMTVMRDRLEITLEYLQAQALQGLVRYIDLEGVPIPTAVHNLYTDFDITEQTVDFVLGTTTTDIKAKAVTAKRYVKKALGGLAFTGYVALCGRTFWDAFVGHTIVKAAFDRWNAGEWMRTDYGATGAAQGFPYMGITWYEYDASIGTDASGNLSEFFPPAECRICPVGVNNLYIERWAPAPWEETVNTVGKRMYAKQVQLDKISGGRKLHAQTNPLFLCLKPAALVKGYTSN